jgi:hypothetical protein
MHFHLHVNCFSAQAPRALQRMHEEQLLALKQFVVRDAGGDGPLWIATTKMRGAEEADACIAEIAARLADDPDMNGYVEIENVLSENIARFGMRTYEPAGSFPVPRWPQRSAPRAADIHVFRPEEHRRDALDRVLLEAGFYEVANSYERIWTLLTGTDEDGEHAFAALKDHFEASGGVTKIELEFTRNMRKLPANFEMRPVAFRA